MYPRRVASALLQMGNRRGLIEMTCARLFHSFCSFILLTCMISLFFISKTDAASTSEHQQGINRLSVKKCIEIALSKNLKIVQAKLEKQAKGLSAKASFKDMLPKLSTQYTYIGRRDVNTVTIFGTKVRLSSHDNYDWQLILSQPIFQGGALWNRYKAAKIDYDMSESQLRQIANDIVRQVKEAYFTVLQARRILQEQKDSVKRLEAHLRDAEGFFKVGLIAKNDLLQSRVELSQARQQLITAKHDLELAEARLNLILRQDLTTPLNLSDTLHEVSLKTSLARLTEHALSHRPEVTAGQLAVKKAQRELKLAKASYLPRIDFNATYEKRGITPDVSDYPFGDHDMAQIMLNATWELWAWGQTRDQVGAAAKTLLAAKAALRDVKDEIRIQVTEAWLRFKEAKENVKVAKTALDQAEENFRLNTQRYKEQLATSTDVLDAEALLSRARTSYFNAIAQELIAKARLDYATGKPIEEK